MTSSIGKQVVKAYFGDRGKSGYGKNSFREQSKTGPSFPNYVVLEN